LTWGSTPNLGVGECEVGRTRVVVIDMPHEESDEEDGGTGREWVAVDDELEYLAAAASSRFLTSALALPLPNSQEKKPSSLPFALSFV